MRGAHARVLAEGPPMTARLRFPAVLLTLLAATPALALPSLPGAAPAAAPSASAPASPNPAAEAVRKGLVLIETQGRVLGVGTVLDGDGRVLSALSGVGTQDQADIRYADGTVVRGRIAHRDKNWDLALVVPLSGKWKDGLRASEADASASELRTATPTRGKTPAVAQVRLRMTTDAKSKEGAPLKGVLDLDLSGSPVTPGTPVLDTQGSVLGLLVRACKAQEGTCVPITVAAPVSAMRSFLMQVPASAALPSPWLGIGGAAAAMGSIKGVRVLAVAPDSPAQKAGLVPGEEGKGDMIVAVDGEPVDSPETLGQAISKRSVGQSIKVLVYSGGRFRDANVTLRAVPEAK
jgi:serine protease Do